MELPKNMTIECDFGCDVLKKPENVSVKNVFDLIDEQSLPTFHDHIQKIFKNGEDIKIRTIKLVDGNNYFITVQLLDKKIIFSFLQYNTYDNSTIECADYFMECIFKYEASIKKYSELIKSITCILQDFFYKNRSNIEDIIKELCTAFRIKYSMLLFRNGCDHSIYFKNNNIGIDNHIVNNEKFEYKDEKFNSDIFISIDDVMKIKLLKDTYLSEYIKDENSQLKKTYVLKLNFGPKCIGYFEFIPYDYKIFTTIEINLIKSLSSILAYIIHNKNEQSDMEKYILEKFK